MEEDVKNRTEWSLVVNGVLKPWPVEDYMNTPITIDLNWGIDTDVYDSVPLTFCVSDILNGIQVDGVTVDEENHQIICNIAIQERSKRIKVIIDWSNVKAKIKENLKANVNGREVGIEEGGVLLKGKEITIPIDFYYHGVKCESMMESGMDMVRVTLPPFNKNRFSKKALFLLIIVFIVIINICISIGYVIGFVIKRPKEIVRTVDRVEVQTDTVYVSKSLNIAQAYLEKEVWKRSEMELIPELQGFFDELNNYRMDTIRYWLERPEFMKIENVRDLLRMAERMERTDVNMKRIYSKDEDIEIRSYIRALRMQMVMSDKKDRLKF